MIKKIICTLLLILSLSMQSFGGDLDLLIGAGLSYGGPIPTEKGEGASGTPRIGQNLGIGVELDLGIGFSVRSGISFIGKNVSYEQHFRRDTIVNVKIFDQEGQVPTYYFADVGGSIELNYLEAPIIFGYDLSRHFRLLAGFHLSILLGGRSGGKVRIQVGEGGFFDDSVMRYSNYETVRPVDAGLIIGVTNRLSENFDFTFLLTRSIIDLYTENKSENSFLAKKIMYNTFAYFTFSYRIPI